MAHSPPADGRAGIDAALVRRLIAAQFPQWQDLSVSPVEVDGWDNRTYRLGDDLTVRLPTGETYALAVEKEHRWLPILAPSLPVAIPVSLALGAPGDGYPFPWSIRRWLDGVMATRDRPHELPALATSVAEFVRALEGVDATGGPTAGGHSFYRGASLAEYDAETRSAIGGLAGRVDIDLAAEVWRAALEATWLGPPVWFHGDVASGNLLMRDGRLAAVIDFGTCGVGDPACDLVIAWTLFTGASREAFRHHVGHDSGTWARARGWALWKALISLSGDLNAPADEEQHRVIDDVLAEHAALA